MSPLSPESSVIRNKLIHYSIMTSTGFRSTRNDTKMQLFMSVKFVLIGFSKTHKHN